MEATKKKLVLAVESADTTAEHTGGGLEQAAAVLGVVTKEQAAAEKAKQLALVKGAPAKLLEARREIKLSQLIESKKNHRKDFGDVDSLGAAMLSQGQLTALTVVQVNPEVFEIVAGARRFRGAKKVGMKTLACDVYDATPEQAMEMRIAENLDRKDLTVMEEAEQLGELKALGYTPATIAKRFDKSVGWAHARLKLLDLGKWARELVSAGKLSSSVGAPLGRLPSETLQEEALNAFEAQGFVTVAVEGSYDRRAKWDDEGAKLDDARGAIEFLQKNFTRSLKSTSFDQEDATLYTVEAAAGDENPGGGACTTCRLNSDNMPDVEKGKNAGHAFCAGVPCFEKKTELAWAATTAKAEEKGIDVMPLEESKKVRPATGIDHAWGMSYGERFVAATAKPSADPKKRTYGQLVEALPEADRPKATLVAGEGKTPVKVFDRKDLEKAFDGVHAWAKKAKRTSSAPKESKEAKAKRQRLERVSVEALRLVLAAIRKKAPAVGELRALAVEAIENPMGFDELRGAIEPHVEGDGLANLFGMKGMKELRTWVEKKAKAPDLVAVLYACQFGDSYANVYGGLSAEVKDATGRHKVDVKKLEKADEQAAAHEAAQAK